MGNRSYIDENTGAMVLRCRKYPQKGSYEWVVSGESIELRVLGKEHKNRVFLLSDIAKARLKIHAVISQFNITFKVEGRTVIVPLISFQTAEDNHVAREIYDYIAKVNPNIPTRVIAASIEPGLSQPRVDETAGELAAHSVDSQKHTLTKAPGRMFLIVVGIIYIILGGFMAIGLLMVFLYDGSAVQSVAMMDVLHTGLRLFIGIYSVAKCNDLTKADTLLGLAVFNLFITISWRGSSIFAILIIFALSILFLIGAAKNNKAYKQLQG